LKKPGVCINNPDYDKFENVLVLHSYHYLYPSRDHRQKEFYAREIGNELGNMHLDGTIVLESPYKRDINALLGKYRSRWLLDLHDPARDYDPKNDSEFIANLGFNCFQTGLGQKFERFLEQNYERTLMSSWNKYPQYPAKLSPLPYEHNRFNPRFVAVELYTGVPKPASLDFLKRLVNYLQVIRLD
jgi:hypothetical protein